MARRKKRKDGFASTPEAKFFEILKREAASNKYRVGYETIKLPYSIKAEYTPDFTLEFKDGRVLYLEVKGYFDYEAQRKMLAVKQQHPELDIRFVFVKDNPIRKRAKMRYSDWCNKNGFPYSVGEVPEEWMV